VVRALGKAIVMVRITHLEITSQEQWVRRARAGREIEVCECVVKQPRFNRFLYEYVGGDWHWINRLAWSVQQWHDYAAKDNLRTFVGYRQGSIVGYYELQKQEGGKDSGPPTPKSALGNPSQTRNDAFGDRGVEVCSFGLTPPFIGQGYGGPLLDTAIENAFAWGARRVWLHTCSLDHPNALNNYLKSGFRIFKVEEKTT
jgi:GNAT superfamily N-acetyltransferase